MPEKNRARESMINSDCALLFLFFLSGASAAYIWPISWADLLQPRVLYSGAFAAALLLSTSCAGYLALPVCSLAFGALMETTALSVITAWQSGSMIELRSAACSLILVPVYFAAMEHGMAASASLRCSSETGSPTARQDYRREMTETLISGIIGCAAVFYFY